MSELVITLIRNLLLISNPSANCTDAWSSNLETL